MTYIATKNVDHTIFNDAAKKYFAGKKIERIEYDGFLCWKVTEYVNPPLTSQVLFDFSAKRISFDVIRAQEILKSHLSFSNPHIVYYKGFLNGTIFFCE